MKGILLAGGTGTRLWPNTKIMNKHMLPVYDRQMIAYPLRTLANAGLRDIHIVAGDNHLGQFLQLLTCPEIRSQFGITEPLNISYHVQEKPGGIAQALGIVEPFVKGSPVAVILGDNIFQNQNIMRDAVHSFTGGGHIFLKEMPEDKLFETGWDQKRRAKYGIATVDCGQVADIEEKPTNPKTRLAVTGLYVFDENVFDIIKTLKPSGRGELEITDVNNAYVKAGKMRYSLVNGGWLDAGDNHDALLAAGAIQYLWQNGRSLDDLLALIKRNLV